MVLVERHIGNFAFLKRTFIAHHVGNGGLCLIFTSFILEQLQHSTQYRQTHKHTECSDLDIKFTSSKVYLFKIFLANNVDHNHRYLSIVLLYTFVHLKIVVDL